MTNANAQKKSSNYKVLIRVAMKLHNPQVVQAYQVNLDAEEETIDPLYSKYLKIYPDDSVWEILIKFCLFYLVDGRLWVQASQPMWWAQKKDSFKPQLTIQYRPVGERKKFGYKRYANNPQLHIPHYNGDDNPRLPTYTIGRHRAKYTLKDETYILINAATLDEAIAVVTRHASYTKEDKRPEGTIEDNITTTSAKKKPRLDGVKIEPFKAEHFEGTKDGLRAGVRIQF
jgi:hypothetical protein